ncbi:MAG: Lrp/AsnC family transcriptional regulator [Acidimicrobiales bacterium]|nr:Lrp/AsnC family transcriptional regulator [Acidimicrobiales bacterium]MCB9395238.1 Lrp/AsnC family transcriptional regulator [Acidimicrobiaceae bacterium]
MSRVPRASSASARGAARTSATAAPPVLVALDDVDRAIIERLQEDGRAPYTRLGAAVGLSEAAVRQRVQRLIDGGVMQVVAVTNPLSIGYRRMAMVGVRTEGPSSAIAAVLESWDDIDYLVVTAGSFDLMCEVVVSDDRDLLDLTNRIRAVDGVRSTETFIYLDLVKQTFTWGAH